jgi:hypothetical protein
MAAYVIYHRDTTRLARRATGDEYFATEAAAKRHRTRYLNDKEYAISEAVEFHDRIEKSAARVNIMTGETYMEPVNTPNYMSPASEAYWAM